MPSFSAMPTKTENKKPSVEPTRKSTAPGAKAPSEPKEEKDHRSVAERLRTSAQTLCLQAIEPHFKIDDGADGRRLSVQEKNAEIAMKKEKMESLLMEWEAIEFKKFNDMSTDKDISDYRQRIFETRRALKNPDGLFVQRLSMFEMSAKEMASLTSKEMVSNGALMERARKEKEAWEKQVVATREEEREAEKLRQVYYRELRDSKGEDRDEITDFSQLGAQEDTTMDEIREPEGADVAVTYAELPAIAIGADAPLTNAEDKRFSMTGIDEKDLTAYEKDGGRWSFAAPPGVAPAPPAFSQPPNLLHETSATGAAPDVEMDDSKNDDSVAKVSNLNEYHDVLLHGMKGVQLGHHHGPPRKKERLLDEEEELMVPDPIPLGALLDHEIPVVTLQRTTTAEHATRYMIFSERRPEYGIGRDYAAGADYIINTSGEKCISRLHATLKLRQLEKESEKKFLCVKDVSANGTWVNDEKITKKEWETLYPGDIVCFGNNTGVPKFVVKSGADKGLFATAGASAA